MVPQVWLYTNDMLTVRVVQRATKEGSEVTVLGSDGLRKQETFVSADAAAKFREALIAHLVTKGYALAWNSEGGRDTED